MGCVPETCRLKSIARKWIGELDIRHLNKYQFIQYSDGRLEEESGDSVCAELNLIKRVLNKADKIWDIGLIAEISEHSNTVKCGLRFCRISSP